MKKLKNIIYLICLIIIFVMLLFFIVINNDDDINNKTDANFKNESKEYNVIDPKLESRIETLNNFSFEDFFSIGWIQVQGTNIDFPIFTPILKSKEENEEVDVDFSYGWRQINYNLGENRMVLSGHNIINVSSKPLTNMGILSDFEGLMAFVYYDFAKENQYIMYTDEDGNEDLYVIYGVGFTNYTDEEYYSIKYEDKEKINKYVASVKENSIYDYSVNVNDNDDIISLITCTRFFGINGDKLFRIDARKLRENEKTYKYKVNKNDNYKKVIDKLNEEGI